MNTASIAMGKRTPGVPAITQRGERRFWGGMAIAMALVAFAGFAPSYYMKSRFGAGPPLTPLLKLHGAVMTAWLLLLVTQTAFIAARRVTWHRRLGIVGTILAALLVVLFAQVSISRAREGILGPGFVPPLQFLPIPLMSVLLVPLLVGAAIYYRKRSDYHKRLIMLANVEIVTPAAARLAILAGASPLPGFLGMYLFIVAIAVRDLVTLRRIHPATLCGGLLLLVSLPVRIAVSTTPAWMAFARWLTG
jgi:hypothetical protein